MSKPTCQRIILEHKKEIHQKVKGRIQKDKKFVLDKKRDVDVWVIDESAMWKDEIIINLTHIYNKPTKPKQIQKNTNEARGT